MLLIAMVMSSNSKLATWQLVLFSSLFCFTSLTGLLCLFQGFRSYRDYRVTRDTPPANLRNLAPGLVKVRGKAECSQLLTAPFSRTPCCFYKTKIEYNEEKGPLDDARYIYGWRELRKEIGGHAFFLADETGKVLVDAPKMFDSELDAKPTFDQSIDQSFLPLNEYRKKLGAGDRTALEHALQAASLSRNHSDGEENSGKPGFRLVEWAVLPGDEYLVIGNYGENPDAQAANRYLISRHKDMPFGLSHRIEMSDYDWYEVLRSQARSNVLVGTLLFLGGMIFLVPIVRYLMDR